MPLTIQQRQEQQRQRFYELTHGNLPVEKPLPIEPSSPEYLESVSFYTELGYPQYGGKYEPFTTPKGYSFKGITETQGGLSITFEAPPEKIPPYILERRRWRERADYGDATPSGILGRGTINQYLVMQRRQEQAQTQAQAEQKQANLRMQQKAFQMEEQRQRLGYYEKTAPPEFKESVEFYTGLGYPKLAGKYEPFTVPGGYKVKGIMETKTGLQVEFEEKMERVPTSLFGPKMFWVKEGEVSEQLAPGLIVKTVPGLGLSPHEQSAMLGMSLIGVVAYPVVIPQLIIPASIAAGIAEAYKFGTMGEHLTVSEIISAAGVGELVGLTAMSLASSKVGREISYQFKQHAPESILKTVYGKEMGSAIAIERQWSWGEPIAKGTAGMLEESYGMPFYRAESLHYAMPTLEWQRVHYAEWLAPRVYAESVFGWEAKALGLQAGKLVETATIHPEVFRTAETLHMNVPTIRKVEQWFMRTSGYQRTPMEVTLQRATEQKLFGALARGGLSSMQELDLVKGIIAPSRLTVLTAPTRLYTQRGISGIVMGAQQLNYPSKSMLFSWFTPIFRQPTITELKTKIAPLTTVISKTGFEQFTTPFSLQRLTQGTTLIQRQSQSQIQKQVQRQKQIQKQLQTTMQTQTQIKTHLPTSRPFQQVRIPTVEDIRKQYGKRRGKKATLDLIGRYKRRYPLATPKQVLKLVIGE